MDNNQTDTTAVTKPNKNYIISRRIIYFILGILEFILAFRLIFKLLGANPESLFVTIIYKISGVFLFPFTSIFSTAATQGLEVKSVLEPANIIGMIVYALVAYGIVMLVKLFTTPKNEEIE